jgi:hypothetical protein
VDSGLFDFWRGFGKNQKSSLHTATSFLSTL